MTCSLFIFPMYMLLSAQFITSVKLTFNMKRINMQSEKRNCSVSGIRYVQFLNMTSLFMRIVAIKKTTTHESSDWPPGAITANGTALCH
jgi:hypothetical protein